MATIRDRKLYLYKGIKVGNGTGAPLALTTASMKFFDVYIRHTATSGDNRLGYFRLYLAGAGNGGECFRVFTTVEAAAGTAHGQHTSLSFGTSGSVSGLGVAHRMTLHGKDAAMFATVAGGQSELYADGASTNYAAATEHSIHRFVNDGDATGKATATNVFAFSGLSTGAGKMFHDLTVSAVGDFTKSLRIVVNGVAYYIPLIAA